MSLKGSGACRLPGASDVVAEFLQNRIFRALLRPHANPRPSQAGPIK